VLEVRNSELPSERRMQFRMGVHLGDVTPEGERLYGDGINIAARLEGLAEPGGVWVSGTIHEQVHAKLPLRFEDLGEQRVKNIPRPVHVYRIRWQDSSAAQPAIEEGDVDLGQLAGRSDVSVFVVPAVWALYVAIGFEILFMISPFALYYYSTYGPSLNFLHGSPWTAWLTHFFLPHFSMTASPLLNSLRGAGQLLVLVGSLVFLACFAQLYWAQFRRKGAVLGGLYRWSRHPQYLALAITGLGTLLAWPRFLVLIAYITMLFLYGWLARVEEERCLRKYGVSYRDYMARTGMFLPGRLFRRLPRILPATGGRRVAAVLALYVAVTAVAIGLTYRLRDYSLEQVSAIYEESLAALSPAVLTDDEIGTALRVAMRARAIREKLDAEGPDAKVLVYVVPVDWELPDVPLQTHEHSGGHVTPADFDRNLYKVLFTRVRTHDTEVRGKDIVKAAYGRDPIALAPVNNETGEVRLDTPPGHVVWGDVPTPLF
jgi:protein-S-isoprenylcysteine O-methyltransferase Ste14